MPACMNPSFKKALQELIQRDTSTPPQAKQRSLSDLAKTPACPGGEPYLALQDGRRKRAPSAYNVFMGECLAEPEIKALPDQRQRFRGCADKWKKKKS